MTSPPVLRAAWVNRPPAEAFAVFTEEIGAWWPLPTHGLFGTQSGSVVFRDDQLIEQSIDGSEVVWAEVAVWDPPNRFVLDWHPGRGVDDASQVEVRFHPDGVGTRVEIEHRGWETFGEDAANRRLGYVGPNAWGYVLDHYADGAESVGVDLAGLEEAYDAFFAEAELGGFGRASEGEWNAPQTLAHVALNDAAMLAVTQSIVHQTAARFENLVCHDADALDRWISGASTFPALVQRGRHMSRLVVASLRRLSPDQHEQSVHCHLIHDGEVMLDRPMPWGTVAVDTQANMHLPAHIEQLRNLRS